MSYSGGLTANWNTLLQRGLNLLDVTDPVACRQNIGAVATTDFGYGLGVSGTTISVDATATGAASKVVRTDGNGDLTTAGQLILGSSALASISRATGANGTLDITNLGSGAFRLNNGTGLIQLVSGGSFQLTAAGENPSTITTSAGLDVGLTNGATGPGLIVTGGLNADSLSGAAISDSTTGTSSTIAASTKAVATAKTTADTAQTTASAAETSAANKLDLTTATAQSVASAVTFTNGLIIPANRGITTFRFYQQWTNGATTTLVSDTSILGYAINILPTTSAVENTDDAYSETDPTSGFITPGICSLPVTGRYFYSFQYTGSVSCSVVVQKGSSAVVTYGPSLAVSGSGTFAAQSGTKVALRVIGGTPTLTANQCWMHIYLINGGSQISKL